MTKIIICTAGGNDKKEEDPRGRPSQRLWNQVKEDLREEAEDQPRWRELVFAAKYQLGLRR